MRVFTDNEREFLDRLLYFKKSGEYKNLHFPNLLSDVLDSLAIRVYNIEKCKFIDLFSTIKCDDEEDSNWAYVVNKFNKILDIVYFIEELEKFNLIRLQVNSWEEIPEMATSLLYNRNLFEYDVDGFYNIKTKEKLTHINNQKIENIYCYTDLLDKYVDKVIYPTPLLEDLANNKYLSIEERHLQKQLCKTNWSIFISAIAAIAAVASNFNNDNPSHYDMMEIKSAILQKKTFIIDSAAKYHVDTINVNVINKPQLQPID